MSEHVPPAPTRSPGLRVLGVVPARFASTRFEGKVLATIGGKPMVQLVYENAQKAKLLDQLVIATEDRRVMEACARFGVSAMMTSADHASGTDRLAEVAAQCEADLYINIQGDEPMVHPDMIDALVAPFLADKELKMATLITKIETKEELDSPNVVKVVADKNGLALYFSRSVIPFDRDANISGQGKTRKALSIYYRHIGIYAYRRDFLLLFPTLASSKLENIEKLEQLRIMEHGYRIAVVETPHRTVAVDTVEDLEKVRRLLEQSKQNNPVKAAAP